MNKKIFKLDQVLKGLPQAQPERDVFQQVLENISEEKKSRSQPYYWLAAASILAFIFGLSMYLMPGKLHLKDQQLEVLTARVQYIESLVLNNLVTHSEPGSELLEKIVSIENLLENLDKEINASQDSQQKINLMHAKLDVLGDLAALHKKLGARIKYQQLI